MSRSNRQNATFADSGTSPAATSRVIRTISDFISGVPVRATPEEIDAVQVFARRLVEDYGYPKGHIQTRPQFRVRTRPSDDEKGYPIDIAVFRDGRRTEDSVYIIVECKQKSRKEGVAQLKLYLDMSPAELGVWFNGEEHLYLRKVVHREGRRTYQELPNIPRHGQRIDDVGLFTRRDLRKPSNLKALFRDIRNHLAGNTTGITRDESLAQEIINLLFCKIFDELNTGRNDMVTFRNGVGEPALEVRRRILTLFDKHVKPEYPDVFSSRDAITLDAASIAYVVGELQPYSIVDADRDGIGEAFEVFIGPALRGAEGQFFTPRNVVRMLIQMLDPHPGERVLDPACGSGGFLITALEHIWQQVEVEAIEKGWSERQADRRKRDLASRCFRGLDKDSFLAKVTKAYMAIIGDGRGGVFCENSLQPPAEWERSAAEAIPLGHFDVVMTNPPFGTKIPIKGAALLSQYELGHKWKRSRKGDAPEPTAQLHDSQPPQILFLERCLQFLKPGGRLGIVLPESILGNPSYEHIITFLSARTTIRAIVTMPEPLFKTSGKGGTHTKVCVIVTENTAPSGDYQLFMSDVKWCGHDSRGNPTLRKNAEGEEVLLDEVPDVAPKYRDFERNLLGEHDHKGFALPCSKIFNRILVPKYYNPEIDRGLDALAATHDIVTLRELVADRTVSIATGIEVGKMAYGTGPIPFIRTSDLSNWEIKADFKHGVSEALYRDLAGKVDVRPLDILMVRDGTYLIGTTAMVTASDVPMLFQSHVYRIRVIRPDQIDPWLLFVTLNSPIVKQQVRSKQFTQDIIDTLGQRVLELRLPIPKDRNRCRTLSADAKRIVETRVALREEARLLPATLQGGALATIDDDIM